MGDVTTSAWNDAPDEKHDASRVMETSPEVGNDCAVPGSTVKHKETAVFSVSSVSTGAGTGNDVSDVVASLPREVGCVGNPVVKETSLVRPIEGETAVERKNPADMNKNAGEAASAALKSVSFVENGEDTSSLQRVELLREAEMMNKARSRYILNLFGVYEEEDSSGAVRLGIVMELMENGSLDRLLQCVVPVPWALKFRLIHEVALGMNYLHGLNPPLLHLDLKTSNVLLDEYFHVRLTDFGLSKWKKSCSMISRSSPGGTLAYMPPEAFDVKQPYKPTTASDIYSYGVLIWSVVTGKEPYSEALPSLIKFHIPKGDRPDSSLLQNHKDVKNLGDSDQSGALSCWLTQQQTAPFRFQTGRDPSDKMPASRSSSGMSEASGAMMLNEKPSQKLSAVPMSLSTAFESEVVGPSASATPSVAAFPSVPLEPGLQQDQQKTSHKPTEESVLLTKAPSQVGTLNTWREDLLDNPESFDRWPCVLGSEGFTSGRHSWVVDVEKQTSWDLGVVEESVNRNGGIIYLKPKCGYWTVRLCDGGYFACTDEGGIQLDVLKTPKKVLVCVDYEAGKISFSNTDDSVTE
nr:PREDICTED: proline-rich receptor-like protein kinase PERK5 [Latimeria chalumnae]|eukprot:XP_014352600.1 PREDICTED: proline-rich receptor-like protein kinase PERK5 [Latimeria chalumnae]